MAIEFLGFRIERIGKDPVTSNEDLQSQIVGYKAEKEHDHNRGEVLKAIQTARERLLEVIKSAEVVIATSSNSDRVQQAFDDRDSATQGLKKLLPDSYDADPPGCSGGDWRLNHSVHRCIGYA